LDAELGFFSRAKLGRKEMPPERKAAERRSVVNGGELARGELAS